MGEGVKSVERCRVRPGAMRERMAYPSLQHCAPGRMGPPGEVFLAN